MPRIRSDRSKKVEETFELVRPGLYKCLCDACHVEVACNPGLGGRLNHLRRRHPEEFEKLPGPAKRERNKPKAKKDEKKDEASSESDGEQPATQPNNQDRAEQPCITQGMVVDFVARNLLPFTLVEDKLFHNMGIHRRNVAELMNARLAELTDRFREYVGTAPVALSIDSGTNVQRTLNVTIVFGGVSRVVASERIDEHTIKNLSEVVAGVVEASRLNFAAFVSDNASNVRGCCVDLAKKFRCVSSGCYCHGLNTFVKKMLYEFPCVAESRALADKIRECGEKVPNEIGTRWMAAYDAVESISKNKHRHIAEERLTRREAETIEQGLAAMKPFLLATRKCDSDESTIFEAVSAIQCISSLPQGAAFNEIFARNMWSNALVLACILSPNFVPELCTAPLRALIEEAFLDVCTDVEPKLDDQPRRLRCELANIMEGHLQRSYRLAKEKPTPEEFWSSGCTPITHRVFCMLRVVPSSSSSVERSFAAHARLHTWVRNSLCEESVRVQLGLHTFLKHNDDLNLKPKRIEPEMPKHEEIEQCLNWCFFARFIPKANQLKEGDTVLVCHTVWFRATVRKESAYRCKLIEKVNGVWRVRWQSDPSNQQRFDPNLDTWQLA